MTPEDREEAMRRARKPNPRYPLPAEQVNPILAQSQICQQEAYSAMLQAVLKGNFCVDDDRTRFRKATDFDTMDRYTCIFNKSTVAKHAPHMPPSWRGLESETHSTTGRITCSLYESLCYYVEEDNFVAQGLHGIAAQEDGLLF
ncbi:hypothetical protein SARC_08778 [Sphaeroforma arctica JP610]|uniref:Uncharacterized protein n=1 Tax=Sphaeroforma arctica JP610 TaxID=667725 RepID=A0A0L0FQ13_9EUKA|nr:hypothetical protein SARC_08778 [Sphaeroforma arctica JP610]KNC78809.1 hypothetical protein SARC_08778 [Sphaeroforma arctica JP610]|eukprot:XP_014152711.1 hypothetical protein SARC_08778 [Sphaeroforma arctica JP610]